MYYDPITNVQCKSAIWWINVLFKDSLFEDKTIFRGQLMAIVFSGLANALITFKYV